VLCLFVTGGLLRADRAESPVGPTGPRGADAPALTALIDQHLAARWAAAGVQPAPRSEDAEFIRRLYLDLAGRIPSIIEVRDFLDDLRPDKRRLWAERLLVEDSYAHHFANVWRAWLLPRSDNQQLSYLVPGFEKWLRQRLKENAGYDRLVRELLTPAPDNRTEPAVSAFYEANERKAENLAASTSRLFLGINLECAQCHNHPFAAWTRTQFWEYAAFFVGASPIERVINRREITIPGTKTTVTARFPDGTALPGKVGLGPSTAALADWMTAAGNPYFARTAVNRVWGYFFGIGLIEPDADAGGQNPPGQPELLDALARAFAAHGYDLKFLIRAITASRAYQLTSAHPPGEAGTDEARLFARMAVRGLSPEQLFDSLAEATEFRELSSPEARVPGDPRDRSPRGEFLARFGGQDRRTDIETTVLQALLLMNGRFVADATSLERSKTLATIADAGSIDMARRVETLYLVALARKPRAEELARLVRYANSGGPSGDPKKALGDIFWALLNSGEFMLNH
jgi:hypothetical protein